MREAVDSVLQQSFTDFEVIVIDDGSTDDTRSVIELINDDRVQYFYKGHGGLASARNLGLLKAQGKYIAFLDDDDLFPENYLQVMLGRLEEKEQYGMAYSLFKDVYPDSREVQGFGHERFLSGYLTKNFFDRMPCILPSATFFRKSALQGFLFDEALRKAEDIDAFLRLSTRTQFLCVPEVCVIRRRTTNSITNQDFNDFCPNTALILERFYFQLGGDKIVSARIAKRKISRFYCSLAREHRLKGHRKAATLLLKKAIGYYPFDQHYYKDLLKTLALSKKSDPMPDWELPKSLPPYITVNQKLNKRQAL